MSNLRKFFAQKSYFPPICESLSLESFPLYGISSSIMRGNVTHTGVSLGSGTMT